MSEDGGGPPPSIFVDPEPGPGEPALQNVQIQIRPNSFDFVRGVEVDESPITRTVWFRPETGMDPGEVSRAQILRLLGNESFRHIMTQHSSGGTMSISGATVVSEQGRYREHNEAGDDDDDEDNDDDDDHQDNLFDVEVADSMFHGNYNWPRRPTGPPPPVPSPAGAELMASGAFGMNEDFRDTVAKRKIGRVSLRLLEREIGLGSGINASRRINQKIAQELIPSTVPDTIIHYPAQCYSGQFSDDGNFFFSCGKDFKVRMYDTSNPYDWKYYKQVTYPYGRWTITDATLSPDNRFLAYSSIRSAVCLASTDPRVDKEPQILQFDNIEGARGTDFGIWSVRFSGDGRELVAGTDESSVYVFDIESNKSVLRLCGHEDDVNAVCFGDKSSPHILYSGSDDTLIKVWDRRSMAGRREAGVFMGHTEGITYVDSKGDGRYVLSNGKDQTMKLWDLRKMTSTDRAATINCRIYSTGFDYRFMPYSANEYYPHPHDCSVVTYRGHSVLKTLIRCHFSPPGSSNSRYVYTGSEDGRVHIFNIDATLAGIIDVTDAVHESLKGSIKTTESTRSFYKTCVRDASWHPNAPILAATSWNSWGNTTGNCSIHAWNDGAKEDESPLGMYRRVNQRLQPEKRGLKRLTRRNMVHRRWPTFVDDDGDSDYADYVDGGPADSWI